MRQVEIVVKGQIDACWSDWFGGFEITHTAGGGSILTGPVRDQAELRGILSRLADLGLELISVNTRRPAPEKRAKGGAERDEKQKFMNQELPSLVNQAKGEKSP